MYNKKCHSVVEKGGGRANLLIWNKDTQTYEVQVFKKLYLVEISPIFKGISSNISQF